MSRDAPNRKLRAVSLTFACNLPYDSNTYHTAGRGGGEMDREALEQLVERLDEAELGLMERVVRGTWGPRLPEVMAKLTDRGLALAARKGFCRQEAFAEWMVQRQGPWL